MYQASVQFIKNVLTMNVFVVTAVVCFAQGNTQYVMF